MSSFQAVIMGIVQGLTEFLPVSSSGHLAVIKGLFGVETDGGVLFEVLLHVATLAAVFAVYYKDVIKILVDFGGICRDASVNTVRFFKNISAINRQEYLPICTTPHRKFVVMLIISTIPTGIMGILLNDVVEVVREICWLLVCVLSAPVGSFLYRILLRTETRSRKKLISEMHSWPV